MKTVRVDAVFSCHYWPLVSGMSTKSQIELESINGLLISFICSMQTIERNYSRNVIELLTIPHEEYNEREAYRCQRCETQVYDSKNYDAFVIEFIEWILTTFASEIARIQTLIVWIFTRTR